MAKDGIAPACAWEVPGDMEHEVSRQARMARDRGAAKLCSPPRSERAHVRPILTLEHGPSGKFLGVRHEPDHEGCSPTSMDLRGGMGPSAASAHGERAQPSCAPTVSGWSGIGGEGARAIRIEFAEHIAYKYD